jgi:hypothetical protein
MILVRSTLTCDVHGGCDELSDNRGSLLQQGHHVNQNLGAATDLVHRVKMSESTYAVTFSRVSPDDSKTNRGCFAVNIVSIQNGLVTLLWSLALLIAVATTVRFPPVLFGFRSCVIDSFFHRNAEREFYISVSAHPGI